jgi:hypothetical protein
MGGGGHRKFISSVRQLGDMPLGWVPQSSVLSSSDSESALFSVYDSCWRLRVDLLASLFAPVCHKKRKRTETRRSREGDGTYARR